MKKSFLVIAILFFYQHTYACNEWDKIIITVNLKVSIYEKNANGVDTLVGDKTLLNSVIKEVPFEKRGGPFPEAYWTDSFEVDGLKLNPKVYVVGLSTSNQITVDVNCPNNLLCGVVEQHNKNLKDLEGLEISPYISPETRVVGSSERTYKPRMNVEFQRVDCKAH